MAIGDIFGGGSSPSINIGPLQDLVRQRAQTQRQITGNLYSQLQPMAGNLRQQLLTAEDAGISSGEKRAGQFLKDIGTTTNLQNKQLSDVLKQRVLGAVPEATAAAKESLAATGGLQRGYAGSTLANIPKSAVEQIGQGEQQLASQALTAKNNAQQQVFNLDEGFIQDRTGLDKNTLMEIYNSGRTDLINQANQLLGIEGSESSDIIGLQEAQMQQQLAQEAAGQQRRNSLLSSLSGLGGTLGGYYGGVPGGVVGSAIPLFAGA